MKRHPTRFYGAGDLDFVTFSCYRRLPLLGSARRRNLFLRALEAARKCTEKLRYLHRNPVTRGLVASPEQWRWSSFRSYYFGEKGLVAVNEIIPPTWAVRGRAA